MDLDVILKELGEYGRFQKNLLLFVFLPCALPCAFHAYNQLFLAAIPAYCCITSEINGDPFNNSSSNVCPFYNTSKGKLCCSEGYKFETSKFRSTVVSEWNLVCGKEFYPTLALALFGLSGFIGNFIFGYIQDRLGRRPAFFIYLLIECVFGIGTAFAWSYWTWVIMRIGVGFTVPAILSTPYVLPIELVGPDYRTRCSIYSNIVYSVGLVTLSLIVYLINSWRLLALVTSVPLLFYFIFWWYMPESPRWLLAVGRFEEAKIVLNQMAKTNGRIISKDILATLKMNYENTLAHTEKVTYGVKDLFVHNGLRKITILITFIWFTNTSVYVGLSYYAPALSGNEFFNFFLAGAAELPTYIILWPAMEYYGRREILCVSMLIGGVSCLLTIHFNGHVSVLILYCIGKMGISSAYVVLPLFASELYPTVVRGIGMSFSSVAGMLGPIFIPLIVNNSVYMLGGSHLPMVIMGLLLLSGGLASLILPETKNISLPQRIIDNKL